MTGFARSEGTHAGWQWAWELKSVNGKGLDLRFRLPQGLDGLEPQARLATAARLKRGNVTLNLQATRPSAPPQLRINRELLDSLLALGRDLEASGVEPPRLDGLLSVRGVIETVEETETEQDRTALDAALLAGLEQALDRLATVRMAEGQRLRGVLEEQLDEIEQLTAAAARCAAVQPEALRERLREQIRTLLDMVPALSEERFAQEAAILISKGDVREEIDRLRAHIAAAREMLGNGGATGRQLDFLCQEFNREANTLCSKSTDVELTRTGLALKAVIEQLREQTQNIE
ncbi:YicC/YloC family endoribonuclease [Arenibaculum pallidiluteum]|uniref:YicC/YloC family endoribonuclease n=1 Tax=Arenibaculum pallidiluteum TaxID=2812559 RepID=UPI001A979AE2|nr:YicC/YloC family endoribonuclease [Arenibaculum pallidiluteum]